MSIAKLPVRPQPNDPSDPNDPDAGGDAGSTPSLEHAPWQRLLDGAETAPGQWCNTSTTTTTTTPIPESHLKAVIDRFPMRINAYFRSLITSTDDPLGRQVVPDRVELEDMNGPVDPLAEESQSPVSQVIHRYPRRVAFQVSNQCALYCRFCMRKRRVADPVQVPHSQIAAGLNYIRSHPVINEVLLTGGDPLMLTDQRLIKIVRDLHRINHVRLIRIHSRMPVALPHRIRPELVRTLAQYHPLFINIHVNHPDELTPRAAAACTLLADAGIPLGSQTVLLKGVNDDIRVLERLMEKLLYLRVRPYYVHQLDRVPGTAHFQVPLEKSIRLVNALRGPLSGMGIPHLMVDLPQGGGKVALTANAVVKKGPDLWQIRNWQGRVFDYPVR